ncbi:hypothetical protein [Butyrivibrio sp. YAB3001]|uniref:hypothetical protein n=1 Tax=Butyrivibrio sp. YAB3001 TaxID=1520812 RepID=UPI0008F674A4|nr:hypothetical protein [Butyrivibrio sp. YAB3001]SFD00163.1 hypothetical protein SAMN02910398_03748 [Butyrivibrio sp. YAB3001]
MKLNNKNHKDTVFRMLYSDKRRLLELYNAINKTNYTNLDDLTIRTLNGNTFLGMKNDVSFILDYEINLYEHNSTPCPNIPLRDLFYIASSYKKLFKISDTYKTTQLKIQTPRFFVFYNGTTPLPDSFEYRLSDMFIKPVTPPSMELVVTVLNVNEGRNKQLMESCETLRGYSIFVSKVRKYTHEQIIIHGKDEYQKHKKALIEKAVTKAIDECISENVLKEFFTANKQEAIDMSTLECTAEDYYHVVADENLEKGIEIGQSQGIVIGQRQGAKYVNNLYRWLQDNGREDDIRKAINDFGYQEKLLAEYEDAHKNSPST